MAVDLIALTPEHAVDVASGDQTLFGGAVNAAKVAGLVRNLAAAQAELYRRTGAVPPWIGYLARDPASNAVVGACSFVGAPRDGEVEIAYFTFPGAEGRGWGAGMAAALVALAWSEPEVVRLIAHTLPEEGPSTKILSRLGFSPVGESTDPEAGPVWKWALAR